MCEPETLSLAGGGVRGDANDVGEEPRIAAGYNYLGGLLHL
ncbi:hypothetical protein SNOG_10308 [Parastagonospora nodorum SN15]|uniref:Uncharacterized protein n=1 Tax=Phaeosphaeria nodorum (strain SN15 / ATCC MYA-4574 / FGSC 10173) TaxID=321614 RepID=Q0UD56_PHANO|nr:hypothetical protein SNOG_10308 [Parastagonospora nodorum SN15]EAT82643.1 hypothetical protein SNOG_10308 [Parastagonospora nodorum SN15]